MQQNRFAAPVAALGRTGRRSAGVLAAFALLITGGATAAEAQPVAKPSPHWTQTPIGLGNTLLNDIDAQPDAIWAVGTRFLDDSEEVRPLVLRRSGGRWTEAPQPAKDSNSTLESVAVNAADDVWAVGETRTGGVEATPLVLHWNGHVWRIVPGPSVPTGSFDEVKVGPDGAVWTAGWADIDGTERAVVYRYANRTWQPLTAGLESSINGNTLAVISKKDAWVGLNAGIAHYDGTKWELAGDVPTNGSTIPTALAAAGPKDIWAVGVYHSLTGELPLAMHYDGVSWTRVPVPAGSAQLYDVLLRNGGPVAVGERFVRDGDTVMSKPLVLEHQGSGFVRAQGPTAADTVGTLTAVDAAAGRLWVAGLLIPASTGEFSAFAAYAK